MDNKHKRYEFAVSVCREAGDLASSFFHQKESLVVDRKGHQDWSVKRTVQLRLSCVSVSRNTGHRTEFSARNTKIERATVASTG